MLGAAIAAKLFPAVLLPGALSGVRRPRDAMPVLLPALAVAVLAYLPYALASTASVFGYLGGYATEEGYSGGSDGRYGLVRLLVPDAWALPVVALAMVAVGAYTIWNGDPARPWQGGLTVTGAAFLLLTPGYSWYALLLIALVRPRRAVGVARRGRRRGGRLRHRPGHTAAYPDGRAGRGRRMAGADLRPHQPGFGLLSERLPQRDRRTAEQFRQVLAGGLQASGRDPQVDVDHEVGDRLGQPVRREDPPGTARRSAAHSRQAAPRPWRPPRPASPG